MTASTQTAPDAAAADAVLDALARRVLWLATSIVDAANNGRKDPSGLKVGGHQASSASLVSIMTSLWFRELTAADRVSVKPHASPVLHAVNHLLGDLDARWLPTLRQRGGLQSYPSRRKDPDTVDFSTGSVGIGATATVWAALSHRYLRSRGAEVPAGRFVALVGDAELDEGAVWEAAADPMVSRLGELLWVVDLNRQSLDRVVPDVQIARLQGMFAAAGWQVLTCKWGHRISALFGEPGGDLLQDRLESMSNEEYQRLLRAPADQVHERLLSALPGARSLRALVEGVDGPELAATLRDLGGHDQRLLAQTYAQVAPDRPTVVFAYTIKGWGLPVEGHPGNHSALLTPAQMRELAVALGTSVDDPWQPLPAGPEATLCAERARALRREPVVLAPAPAPPTSFGRRAGGTVSTQAALGRFLLDLRRTAPEVAERVVTLSPDVASSTNLGGWINATGVWSVLDRQDWFLDDDDRLVRWTEGTGGQHMELGIAETNLVGLLGELGATWSRTGHALLPIATVYDPFVARCLEPWSFGIYAGGQSILVGTPSGVTLAAEGGAHQSITSPSIGLEQPECTYVEPAFAQDLEWTMLDALGRLGRPGGTSSYFRLSTRPVDQSLAAGGDDETRRRQCVAGGYRMRAPDGEQVTLVGVGAILPEVLLAADRLAGLGVAAGVVCVTSPDLLFRDLQARGGLTRSVGSGILSELFPGPRGALVTVLDGHPHTLAFLAGVRGDALACLGVTTFGESGDLADMHALHGLDVDTIVGAALDLLDV
ncbi:MAG TPA: pyruvate dehydrogenase [Mycobacteriales bacterium]|jgi:pyruvate dehydrogenase E1 component|nr:pyruvate dehydrogenase [Mycobacteriales bacterium]